MHLAAAFKPQISTLPIKSRPLTMWWMRFLNGKSAVITIMWRVKAYSGDKRMSHAFYWTRLSSVPLLSALLAAAFVTSVVAHNLGTCAAKDYKVLSESAVAIRCTGDSTGLTLKEVSLFILGETRITPLSATVTVSHFNTSNDWLLLTLAGAESTLKPKQKYRMSSTYVVTDSLGHPTPTTEFIDIDTANTVVITPTTIKSQPQEYRATSHVGFSEGGK